MLEIYRNGKERVKMPVKTELKSFAQIFKDFHDGPSIPKVKIANCSENKMLNVNPVKLILQAWARIPITNPLLSWHKIRIKGFLVPKK